MDWLHAWMPALPASLVGLFLLSLLAATVLPGGSEAALAAVLLAHPEATAGALLLATLGNTAGGMISWAMGRALPPGPLPPRLGLLQRHGSPILLLAWTPLLGDALCVAAGWLRLPALPCAVWMALGKGARYGALAWTLAG